MSSQRPYEIDLARLEADVNREEGKRRSAPVAWRLRRWGISLFSGGVLFMVVMPLLDGEWKSNFDPDGYRLWIRIAGTIIFVAIMLALDDRRRTKAAGDPNLVAAQFRKEIDVYSGAGWGSRTVRMGIKMGLAIGIPIGLLLAVVPIGLNPTLLERLGIFAGFVAATLLWTVPAAFFFRLLILSSMRKYLVKA